MPEIIPVEPDPDNAGVGNKKNNYPVYMKFFRSVL